MNYFMNKKTWIFKCLLNKNKSSSRVLGLGGYFSALALYIAPIYSYKKVSVALLDKVKFQNPDT